MRKRLLWIFILFLCVLSVGSFFVFDQKTLAEDAENTKVTAQTGAAASISSVYRYHEISMGGNALTLTQSELQSLLSDSGKEGLLLKSADGAIIMNREYLSSLAGQTESDIVFSLAVKDDTCAVSAKSNGSALYGSQGFCLAEVKKSGTTESYVAAGERRIGVSACYTDANVIRWQLTTAETYTFAAESKSFADTENHWARESISSMAAKGIVNGVSAAAFAPDANVTRGQFITFLARTAAVDTTVYPQSAFSDVKADAYYSSAVAWGVERGIIKGMSATAFVPDANVTRQDMATMCSRYLSTLGIAVKPVRTPADFSDAASFKDYAATAIADGYNGGYINGRGEHIFAPQATATRAEAVTMIAGMTYYITAMPH